MGPLNGITVIELGGIGPGPMAGMLLADMDAEVVRVERSLERPRFQRKDASFRQRRRRASVAPFRRFVTGSGRPARMAMTCWRAPGSLVKRSKSCALRMCCKV
ncbi:MAG TPA: CoA transferase [Steroidobacteraceae bacterium]|nr:CoA transferase [Steroidobacteraceae bacterium]